MLRILTLVILLIGGAPLKAAQKVTLFEREVLPIFQARCVRCHGEKRQRAGLDLRSKAGLLRGGENGPSIVPGDAKKSHLWKQVISDKMPPEKAKLSQAEKGIIRAWIDNGAHALKKGAIPLAEKDRQVTEEDRQFWAFQKPKRPTIPKVTSVPIRNPIDAFLLKALQKKSLTFSPEANRLTLLRRASFDLLGLPPSPDEIQTYLDDQKPGAYERMIDRLLASPHYGERWARHWLDIAGYADSEGILDADYVRKAAWRYRDYVIRAMNKDKPYDCFLQEQLAGDEMVDYWTIHRTKKELPPEVIEALIATGYLRCASDTSRPDFAKIKNAPGYYFQTLDDTLRIVSTSLLGLTVQCAKCHSHKYDPIPQRDYYRMQAIFMSGYRPSQWVPQVQRRLLESTAWQEKRVKKKNSFSEIRAFYDLPGDAKTFILRRGDYLHPGREVRPGVLATIATPQAFQWKTPPKTARTSGRRLAFARWITQPQHPLTARVLVNRLWMHHFGTGLVKSVDNFGHQGDKPSHPKLLDWLATELVRRGWSIKQIHRLMMTSQAYRQTSSRNAKGMQIDPENRLIWRQHYRRLEAEALRDAVLRVAGTQSSHRYGTPVPMKRLATGEVIVSPNEAGHRRSIYLQVRRSQPLTFLQAFDHPVMQTNCTRRSTSTVSSQALTLLNSDFMVRQADAFANRILKSQPHAPADLAVRLAFGRSITSSEKAKFGAFLKSQAKHHLKTLGKNRQTEAHRRALADLCHVLLSSNEFAYLD